MGAMVPVLRQIFARPQTGDLAENATTWEAAENTAWTATIPIGGVFHFTQRISFQEEGAVNATPTPTLFYRKNGGTWTRVDGASSNVRASLNTVWADNVATTELLTAGAGAFQAGQGDEVDGQVPQTAILKTEYTEMIFSLDLREAELVDTDTIELRIQDTTTAFDFYDAASLVVITIILPSLLNIPSIAFSKPLRVKLLSSL